MYAVIKAGGKQQRVKPGDVIEVELMHGQQGEGVTFTPILVVDDDGKAHVGKELGKATVSAKLVGEHKGEKVKVFKYRQKTGYRKTQGHRQLYTLVEIEDVSLGSRRAASKKATDQAREAPQAEVEAVEPEAAAVEAEPTASEPTATEVAEPEGVLSEEVGATGEEASAADGAVEAGAEEA
jgi:large subunit ribosomal protein L21